MRKALLITNPEKNRSAELALRTRKYLKLHGVETCESCSFDEDLTAFKADFAITFGGDGTVLNTVRRLSSKQIPIITVNLGRLGFLAEVNPEDIEFMLKKYLQGNIVTSSRMRLCVKLFRNGEVLYQQFALNEVSFVSQERGRVCNLNIEIDNRRLTEISGDGLIVATATGSTAYSLSAGGPILSTLLKSMLLVPVCAHRLTNRPLVLSKHEKLSINGRSTMSCDGIHSLKLQENDFVEICCSDYPAEIVTCSKANRYDTLRRKLNWGE